MLLFDSFGFTGSKESIIDNDHKIIDKLVYGLKKFNKKDNKITLISLTFSAEAYKILSRLKSKLTTTAQDLFYVINEFGKTHTLKTIKLSR